MSEGWRPLYLLPNLAKLALKRGEIRLQDYGRTWEFVSLKVGEPVDVEAYMKRIGVVGFQSSSRTVNKAGT